MALSGVGAVGAVGGSSAVYAASPYLNGVTRVSDAVAAAQLAQIQAAEAQAALAKSAAASTANAQAAALDAAAAQTAGARAVVAQESATAAQATFANPAIADIAQQAQVRLDATNHSSAFALSGDSGTVIQSYGAVALLTGPLAITQFYGLAAAPAIPPVAPVTAAPRVARVDAFV